MRISDWSSDVCSSDLLATTQPPLAISRRYIRAGQTIVGLIVYPDPQSENDRGHAQLYAVHADLIGAPRLVTDSEQRIRWLEIGRASCRERVWQYVSF